MTVRVAYWCSSFDADMEAVAGEVACLRRAFPGSITWGIAARERLRLSLKDGFGVHPRLQLLFRGFTWLAQQCYDVQHLFGGLGDWFHLRAVRRRPVVMTVACDTGVCEAKLLNKVDRFVVEWPGAEARLLELGIERERVRTILPPVDLQRFSPSPQPQGPLRVLFASSPDRAEWLGARGVDLLLDAAALCPEYRFVLVWRPWGDSLPRVREWLAERRLANVELMVGKFGDMSQHYREAHVTVAPFVDLARCKPLPNSVVESLACGRPVVVTPCVGVADLVAQAGAGVVTQPAAGDLADSLRQIESGWSGYSAAARSLAERRFSQDRFIAAYRELYREVA